MSKNTVPFVEFKVTLNLAKPEPSNVPLLSQKFLKIGYSLSGATSMLLSSVQLLFPAEFSAHA